MNSILLLAFALYLIVLFGISLLSSWYVKTDHLNTSSFLLGGRSLNYWVTAISAHAADMSDWLLMGFPAAVYMNGMPSVWVAIGLVVGMALTWHFIAPRLRAETEKYDAYTLTSYFERRFNDQSGLLRITGAILIAFFFAIYLAAGVKGVGLLLKSVFGLPYHVGGFLGILVVIAYTIIGGFIAAGWTELFQGIFLLLMLMVTPLCAYMNLSGQSIISAAYTQGISLSLVPDFSLSTLIGLLVGPVSWGLGYFGMPHVLVKFCGARDVKELTKSKYIGMTWQILALASASAVGIVGIAYFESSPLIKPELIFIEMTKNLFPSLIAGFVLCAFLAATLSTMDAQLLVLAGIVAEDIYKGSINKVAQTKDILLVYRGAIVALALIAYAIAYNEHSTVFGLVQYAWGGLGASFGPLVISSLYSRYVTKSGAAAAMICGGLTSALWKYGVGPIAGIQVNEIVPGFVVGFMAIYVVSYITTRQRTKR